MKTVARKKGLVAAAVVGAIALSAAGVAAFALHGRGADGPPQNDMAVDAASRAAVIDSIIANLDRYYVYPEKAAAMSTELRAQRQRGDFDAVFGAEEFADRLTNSLQAVTHDKHLEVRYFEQAIPDTTVGDDETPEDQAAELVRGQRFNFGFENVGRLRGDIGYIDLHQFSRPAHTTQRIAAAMALLADTHALIIDLRRCGGGDPETVMLFSSYLFDGPTHLNDIYWRDEDRTEERWTTDTVPGIRYGQARKIYLLTSSDTFSACEDFAYAMKYAGRAKLVGETTGGGAHPGSRRRLDAHFMMNVPSGRAINPVTQTDWEGVGVVPDVATSAKTALDVAQIAALHDIAAVESDPEWKRKLLERIAELD